MGSEARGLLQDADGQLRIELFQANGAGEAGRPGAHNRHFVFHDIAGGFRSSNDT